MYTHVKTLFLRLILPQIWGVCTILLKSPLSRPNGVIDADIELHPKS